MNRFLRIRFALTAVATCCIAGFFPPSAHAEKEKKNTAIVQSDGIVDRVVDHVWERTDYYWHHGDYNRIIALLRICVSLDPSFVDAYSNGAWLMWSMGDIPASDAFMEDGLKNSPARAEIANEYGMHLFETKAYTEASKYLSKAISLGMRDRVTYTMLGHCYRLSGHYDESIATWKKVIQKFPNFPAAKANLAKVENLKKSGAKPAPESTPNGSATAH